MIRTLIIGDEPMLRQELATMLPQHADVLVLGQCSLEQETRMLIEVTRPELIFLDSQLANGITALLFEQPVPVSIVFVTACNEYAIQALQLGAIDYLLKPFDGNAVALILDRVRQKRIATASQRSLQQLQPPQGPADRLVLRTHDSIYFVVITDILYCQSEGNYTTFFVCNQSPILVSKSIKQYEQLLPVNQFIRTHQSYLVNKRWVERLRRDESILILRSGISIPVSIRRRDEVIEQLSAD